MESKQVHLNDAQLEVNLVQAQFTLAFMGRGGGKTHGLGGPFTVRNVMDMPRGNHFVSCSSYEKVLNDILPKLQKSWEEQQYYEGVHYWVRQWAPERLHIPKPYLAPTTPHYIIHWFNGSVNRLVSVDRPKLFVGTDGDSLFADEVRLYQEEIFTQLLLNLRGNSDKFGHLANHLSVLMVSDLPRDRKGEWLFEFEKEMDPNKVKLILQAQQRIFELSLEQQKVRTKKAKRQIQKTIDRYHELSNDLRRDLVYVKYASSLENVDVLGIDTIKKWQRTMSEDKFNTSVLTIRRKQYGKYFYSMFNPQSHCYTATNFEVVDQMHHEEFQRARWYDTQTDVEKNLPLELSGDYNAAIIWLTIGQKKPGRLNVVGSLFMEKPKKVKDLAKRFDYHFGPKKRYNNQLVFHFDQTAKGTNAINDDTYIKEWQHQLEQLGWRVRLNDVGAAPRHTARHLLWTSMCDHSDIESSNLYLNRNTNEQLIKTIEDAPVQRSGNDFKKDKRSEYSDLVEPKDATHGTEALDLLLWGCEASPLRVSPGFWNTLTHI